MNLQHLNIKIMVAQPEAIDFELFIPLFHRWIQTKATDEMLIDVADYLHVPEGPGVMLIGHEALMSLDNVENRWGFLYNRRTPMDGSNTEKMNKVMKVTLGHARRLEEDSSLSGKLKFRGEDLQLIFNDRLLTPNTDDTFRALEPDLNAFLNRLYSGTPYLLKRHSDPRERLTLDVKAEKGFGVNELLRNIGDRI